MKQENKDRLFAILVLVIFFTGSYLVMKAERKNGKTNDSIFNKEIRYYR